MKTYVAEFFPRKPKTDEEPEQVFEVKADGEHGALRKALNKLNGGKAKGKYIWIYPKDQGVQS